MKNKPLFVALGGLLLLAAIFFFFKQRPEPPPPTGSRGDLGRPLASRVAQQPKPSLSNFPALPAAAAPAATAHQAKAATTLSEAQLEPLRRTFAPMRFTEDPAVPRERQTLLSNRLLVAPEQRTLPAGVSGKQSPTPRKTTPFIVQFNAPVSDDSRQRLTEAGALVRGFFPNNAILAELTPAALTSLATVDTVQTASEYLPNDKLQPFLSSLIASYPAETTVRMTVQTLSPEDAEPVAAAVRAAGGTVEGTHAGTRWGIVQAVIPLGAVTALTARGEVQWIEERPLIQRRNDRASIPSHLNLTHTWQTWGLTGKGQIVGHADTGLDTGDLSTLHPDFQGRVLALIARGRPGDASDPHGHGTHTAGSILGSGAASGGQYLGTAYEAQLVHQSVMDEYGSFAGLGSDLYPFFAESFAYGACIHSDSWGSDTYGGYDSDCRSADLFAWDHPEHLALFASGNSGRDGNADGVVDTGAVGSPAAAKNVVAVGATENDRAPGSGGYSSYTWGTAWPTRYTAAPIKNDYISYSATTVPYRQGMAAFSSRGPTQDARIKPDLVAPGTDVISTKSAVGSAVWRDLSGNPRYCFGGGTSMSTPLVAGTAVLLRQYAVERGGITNPSAALLKAMLIGGSRSLAPGQYTNATPEIPALTPNNVEGWGQPDISATVHPDGRMVRLLDRIAPATGMTNTFDVFVTASNTPLDIALAWIDYPATAGAGLTRVNDLDLLVTTPDGSPLYPNGKTTRDLVNTVETLRLAAAQPGTYRVQVIGASVPYSGGAAALYVRGAIAAPPLIVHAPLSAQIAGTGAYPATFQVQSLALLTNGATQVYWTTGDAAAPTGTWQAADALWLSNRVYQAAIPAQPAATRVYYYLQAEEGGYVTRSPLNAPEAAYPFYVDTAAELIVEGAPARFGTVTPPYGSSLQIITVPFDVHAPLTVDLSNGVRRLCAGWTGTGDVPASSATNAATLTISQPSSLTWQWQGQFALTNRFRLADTGELFDQTVAWFNEEDAAATVTALEHGFVGSTPYAFCGWTLDGARWPAPTGTSPNPATGIPMDRPHLAQGDYLPYWQDTDGNGLSDWWEQRYFGTSSSVPAIAPTDDLDGDFWTNLAEFLDNTDPNDPASAPVPPHIAVNALAPFQTVRSPWSVSAVITDNMTVELAYLVWRERGDTDWQTNAMAWVEGDTYAAQLDPPSHGAKRVDYFVVALDLVGYYAPEFGASSPVYSVIGDYDTPWLAVTPDRFDLFQLSDTPTNISLAVANLAGPDLVWTARVASAAAPFAATNASWSHAGVNDAWCVTTNRTWNGDKVWYCGNAATRAYPNDCHAWLDTPAFQVGTGGGLLFRQWIKTERDVDETHFWDGAVIRLSTDGGASFTLIEPTDGYPYLITDNPASPFPADQPCLAGEGQGWQTLLLDLAAYAGQEVIVRFEFGSDGYVIDEGWYLAGVTPFSLDAPVPPWLIPHGAWGGTLPDLWTAPLAMTLDPTAIAFNDEVSLCLRIESNDPSLSPLIPLTLRRGHFLAVSANGPGTASTDRTFLFRDEQATVQLQAEQGAYLYSVMLNGVPQPGIYDYTTTSKTLVFDHLSEDLTLVAWFTSKIWHLTVYSPYNQATPANGTYAFTNNTPVTATVASPEELGFGVRRQCAGWTLTGHTPDEGSTPSITFSITNDATLTWRWVYAHQLTVEAGPNGTAAPEAGWYESGSTAVITASPAAYYHVGAWSGDISGALIQSNQFTATMYEPRHVGVSFEANLTALRGVPEYWLAAYGWTANFEAAAETDTDSDGHAAWQEWRADTDPTNGLSVLKLTGVALTNGQAWVFWSGGVARTQILERAQAPNGPWLAIHTNTPPTAVNNGQAYPAPTPGGFFRVSVP